MTRRSRPLGILLSLPSMQDALADRWFTRQRVLQAGQEQWWSSLPGGKSTALHRRDSGNVSSASQGMQSCHCRCLWWHLPGISGCHQIPECPHLSEFPYIPGGGLVTLHRVTADVGAVLYPTLWVTFTLRDILSIVRALGAEKGLFYTQAAQRSWPVLNLERLWAVLEDKANISAQFLRKGKCLDGQGDQK